MSLVNTWLRKGGEGYTQGEHCQWGGFKPHGVQASRIMMHLRNSRKRGKEHIHIGTASICSELLQS